MKIQRAFTLAEVLITLGIIGVVAAMTMPSLINATHDKQYITAYKRGLATMSQAIAINYALENVDLSSDTSALEIFKNRMNVTGLYHDGDIIYFNDGTSVGKFGVSNGSGGYTPWGKSTADVKQCTDPSSPGSAEGLADSCTGIGYDVNGKKGPNVVGKDMFLINFTKQGVVPGDERGLSIIQSDR